MEIDLEMRKSKFLFGTGILTPILTYFTFILGKKDNDKLV